MKQLAVLVLCAVVLLRLVHQSAAVQYDDDRFLDGEPSWQHRNTASKELATWVMQLLHRGGDPALCAQKRNAELINSLLALPKVLNDAGRK